MGQKKEDIVIINVTKGYRIEVSSLQYTALKHMPNSKNKDKSYWSALGYHANLGSAVISIIDAKFQDHNGEYADLKSAVDRYKAIRDEVMQTIDKAMNEGEGDATEEESRNGQEPQRTDSAHEDSA